MFKVVDCVTPHLNVTDLGNLFNGSEVRLTTTN